MRPASIIRFEQFYLGATAITVVLQVLNFVGLVGPDRTEALGAAGMLIVLAMSYGMTFLFWAPFVLFRTSQKVYKNRRNPRDLALGWFRIVPAVPGGS